MYVSAMYILYFVTPTAPLRACRARNIHNSHTCFALFIEKDRFWLSLRHMQAALRTRRLLLAGQRPPIQPRGRYSTIVDLVELAFVKCLLVNMYAISLCIPIYPKYGIRKRVLVLQCVDNKFVAVIF